MRKRHSGGGLVGLVMLLVGIIIIMALILPTGFWWFILGAVLIALGILFFRNC